MGLLDGGWGCEEWPVWSDSSLTQTDKIQPLYLGWVRLMLFGIFVCSLDDGTKDNLCKFKMASSGRVVNAGEPFSQKGLDRLEKWPHKNFTCLVLLECLIPLRCEKFNGGHQAGQRSGAHGIPEVAERWIWPELRRFKVELILFATTQVKQREEETLFSGVLRVEWKATERSENMANSG